MATKQGEPGEGLFKKRQHSLEREGRNTSSNEPKMIRSRIFIGNLDEKVVRPDLEVIFKSYGKIIGVSLHKNFGFVQFDNEESAHKAIAEQDGKMIQGKKAEVNMVSERMKEPIGRRRGRSRSPRPSRFGRDHRDMDFRSRRRRSPPPPHFRGPPDRFRDPFFRPPPPGYLDDLDDPFDLYPPEPRMYMREPPLPPPRRPPFGSPDFMPPRRERFGPDFYDELDRERMRERVREREPHSPPPRLPPPPLPPPPSLPPQERGRPHMEIIVVNRLQRDYAESVRQKTEALGLNVSIVQLSLTVSLTAAMENAAQRGLLYTVIITAQHEAHRSITLTILRGRNPQEHKNMPLGDALGLIERDFTNYCYGPSRDSLPPPSAATGASSHSPARSSVSSLMSRAATGEQLNESELSVLISSLQQRQAKPASSRPLSALGLGGGSSSHAVDSSMQRQQADLQAKILSLLGSSAVVPASKPASSPSAPAGRSGYGSASRYTEDALYGDYSYTDRYRQPSYGGFH